MAGLYSGIEALKSLIFGAGILAWIAIIAFCYIVNRNFKNTTYYKITKNSILKTIIDKGRYGEYLIYKRLRRLEGKKGRFLFNVYIPKEDGTTTEIDALMITSKGILVFESKNYSGWIFGNETSKNWTQTLPQGRGKSKKTKFLNPVIQNKGHIKHLKEFLGGELDVKSIVVFSERCTLKDITMKSEEVKVINRYDIVKTVKSVLERTEAEELTEQTMMEIYEKLYPLTQVSDEVKEEHVKNIVKVYAEESVEEMKEETLVEAEDAAVETKEETAVEDEHINIEETVIPRSAKENAQCTESTGVLDENESTVEKETAQESVKCPRCGGNLVLRVANRGKNAGNQFYGCSNYPKCRYVKEISEEDVVEK